MGWSRTREMCVIAVSARALAERVEWFGGGA